MLFALNIGDYILIQKRQSTTNFEIFRIDGITNDTNEKLFKFTVSYIQGFPENSNLRTDRY